MTSIPIVDFAKATSGFVYLKNHGVPCDKVEECFDWSRRFLDLPIETKMLAPHPPGGSHHRGYSAPGVEKVSQHEYDANELNRLRDMPDFKESHESGNVNDNAQPNIWLPEDKLPGFQASMESYFIRCADLVHRILDSLSIALQVPEPGLSPPHSQSLFQLRLLHYPAIASEELAQNNRSRINAHSDFGTLTLLFQDSVDGLEIEDPHSPGAFRAAKPIQNTVLVNVGDLMARWSNDRWRSTIHRVGIPPNNGEGVIPRRYSIPFFAVANMDAVIEALPGCWDEKKPPKKYEPFTAWGYVQMRMKALYEG